MRQLRPPITQSQRSSAREGPRLTAEGPEPTAATRTRRWSFADAGAGHPWTAAGLICDARRTYGVPATQADRRRQAARAHPQGRPLAAGELPRPGPGRGCRADDPRPLLAGATEEHP